MADLLQMARWPCFRCRDHGLSLRLEIELWRREKLSLPLPARSFGRSSWNLSVFRRMRLPKRLVSRFHASTTSCVRGDLALRRWRCCFRRISVCLTATGSTCKDISILRVRGERLENRLRELSLTPTTITAHFSQSELVALRGFHTKVDRLRGQKGRCQRLLTAAG